MHNPIDATIGSNGKLVAAYITLFPRARMVLRRFLDGKSSQIVPVPRKEKAPLIGGLNGVGCSRFCLRRLILSVSPLKMDLLLDCEKQRLSR